MTVLVDRLSLSDDLRASWLETNDTYLICELNKIFKKELFIRGHIVDKKQRGAEKAEEYFNKFPDVDYFIYSSKAPTHCDLKYVKQSRILFYRPSKTWGVVRGLAIRPTRTAACRFVRLKQQILTIFEEEIYSCTK